MLLQFEDSALTFLEVRTQERGAQGQPPMLFRKWNEYVFFFLFSLNCVVTALLKCDAIRRPYLDRLKVDLKLQMNGYSLSGLIRNYRGEGLYMDPSKLVT